MQRATEIPLDDLGSPNTNDQQPASSFHIQDSRMAALQANFPLPRELRDHIYSYLLDAKHTRVIRARTRGRAYKFHTSILGVNREIHDEAEEYLYKHNIFTVISHQFVDPEIVACASLAPSVAQLHNAEFVHRSLEVHLSEVPRMNHQQSEVPRSHWLFLSIDLDLYSLAMSLPLVYRVKHAPMLVLDGDGLYLDRLIDTDGRKNNSDRMKIKFCSHRYSRPSRELQASLLAPFCTMKRPGLLVTLSGDVLDQASACDLEISMRLNVACFSAINWHILEALGRLKAAADTLARAGELTIAEHMYKSAKGALERARHSPLWLGPEITTFVLELLFDTLLSTSSLYMEGKDQTEFARTIASILELTGVTADEDSNPVTSRIFHLHMLAVAVAPSEETLPPFPEITVAECIARLSTYESDHQLHDLAILKSSANHSKIFHQPEDLPTPSCSFFAVSGRVCPFGERITLPDHIVDFLDVLQLRTIGKEQRTRINKLQTERGWHVTRFEDYDD